GHAQNLLALQGAVRLHFNVGELVIRIVEEKALGGHAAADVNRENQGDDERNPGKGYKELAIPMLDRFSRANFNVEQMLLPTLPDAREPAITRAWSLLSSHLPARSLLKRDNSMMRRQSST